MKALKINTLFLLLVFASSFLSEIQAQQSIEELAALDDKDLFSRAYFGTEELRKFSPEKVKPLKKVGLISVILYDQSFKKLEKTESYSVAPEGVSNYFADKILDISKADMKQALADMGVDLLFSEDYLDSEEKKSKYASWYKEYIYTARSDDFIGVLNKNPDFPISAKGYLPFYPSDGGRRDETIETFGKITQELGLDAVLVISVHVQSTNISVSLQELRMTLHTERLNPEKRELGGLHYGTYTLLPKDWIPFVGFKKGEMEGERYDGFAPLLSRLSAEFINIVGTEFEVIQK